MACEGKGKVMLAAGKSIGSLVDVIVVGERPLGFYFILGLNGRESRWCKITSVKITRWCKNYTNQFWINAGGNRCCGSRCGGAGRGGSEK